MNLALAIILIIVALLAGAAGGIFLTQRQVKQQFADNPPLSEDAIRMIMSSMGRKPSEVQVQQTLRQIRASAKAQTKKK
ncbi:MAG: YneF family protein [Streptococcaceae bacterium]|jgi:uncharacterized protein YneF (UPF0154 family)|nr:YneF family protein [Streptococcaceae bacterium]